MPDPRGVETAYGRLPGCPQCGVVKLHGEPMLCEHGVTAVVPLTVEVTIRLGGEPPRAATATCVRHVLHDPACAYCRSAEATLRAASRPAGRDGSDGPAVRP